MPTACWFSPAPHTCNWVGVLSRSATRPSRPPVAVDLAGDDLGGGGDVRAHGLDALLEVGAGHVGGGALVGEGLDEDELVGFLDAARPLEEDVALLGAALGRVVVDDVHPLLGGLGLDGELDDDEVHAPHRGDTGAARQGGMGHTGGVTEGARAVRRTLALLGAVADRGGASAKELAEELDLPLPTVYRLAGSPFRATLLGRSHWEVFPDSVEAPVGRVFRRVEEEDGLFYLVRMSPDIPWIPS